MIQRLYFQKTILFIGDIVFLYISLLATLALRYGEVPSKETWDLHRAAFLIIYLIWILVFYIGNFYDSQKVPSRFKLLSRLIYLHTINGVISVAFFYLIPFFAIAPKTTLFLNFAVSLVLIYGWRTLSSALFDRAWIPEQTAIIGLNPENKELTKSLVTYSNIGYSVNVIFDDKEQGSFLNIPIFPTKDIKEKLSKYNITTVIGALALNEAEPIDVLYQRVFDGLKFYDATNFYENLTGKIPLSLVHRAWFLENISSQVRRPYDMAKKWIDIIAALILGTVGLVLFPFIALGIKLNSKGPLFYKQKRVGQGGKIFELVKFRTMRQNAEENGPQFAQHNDPRITSFGKMLRITRIDELPQLWNVLKGELSLIGPRPERPEFVKEFEEKIPYYQVRHLIKPGLSGWAQINYEYAANLEETYKKLQYELYYIKNRSFLLDLSIILKTINLVLRRGGR